MALRGNLGQVLPDRMRGWAFDAARPNVALSLVVLVNGEVVARGRADRPRPDLIASTKDDGLHGFDIFLPKRLPRGVSHIVDVRREEDGASLPNLPRVVELGLAFDPAIRAEWSAVLATAESDDEHETRIVFLESELAKLRASYLRRAGNLEALEHRRRSRWAGIVGEAEGRRRALVIDVNMPNTQRDAGSNAIVSHMKSMQTMGYEVSFACPSLSGDPGPLEGLGIHVFRKPFVASLENLLQQGHAFDVVYLHRVAMAARYMALARAHLPRARIVYSVADLHHVRELRQSAVERRPELQALAQRTRAWEIAAAIAADAVITHSHAEAKILARHMPSKKICVALWEVPSRPVTTTFAVRSGVAFVAGFGHSPNVDAAHWLVGTIMPEVWKQDPCIGCVLAGSQTPAAVHALAGERIEVLGFVPEIATVFERVRLSVAPLAYGAGVKGKVLESLAAGVPCVCTPVAAEGFAFSESLSRLVGRDSTTLAAHIVEMHNNAAANAQTAHAGLSFVAQFASQDAVSRALAVALL